MRKNHVDWWPCWRRFIHSCKHVEMKIYNGMEAVMKVKLPPYPFDTLSSITWCSIHCTIKRAVSLSLYHPTHVMILELFIFNPHLPPSLSLFTLLITRHMYKWFYQILYLIYPIISVHLAIMSSPLYYLLLAAITQSHHSPASYTCFLHLTWFFLKWLTFSSQ